MSVPEKAPKKAEDEYWKTAPDPATYGSFGDQGLTATVGAYGSLLRICCPILSSGEQSPDQVNLDGRDSDDSEPEDGNDPDKQNSGGRSLDGVFQSKILCLEHSREEAYFVWARASRLENHADDFHSGFGLRLDESIQPELSTLDFVDNRWPIIKYKTKQGFSITVRAWCQDGMVVQQMLIDRGTDGPDAVKLSLDMNFVMQDLNYMQWAPNMNMCEDQSSESQAENCLLLKGQHNGGFKQSQIGVLVGLFKDNESHPVRNSERPDSRPGHAEPSTTESRTGSAIRTFGGDPQPIALEHVFVDQEIQVTYTAAFRLQVASSGEWISLAISTVPKEPSPSSDGQLGAFDSYEDRVNWHCRRHLEHILSVCSIPLDKTPLKIVNTPTTSAMKHTSTAQKLNSPTPAPGNRGVALTCGDTGDHRVSISGGYFAFMFMLEMYKLLEMHPNTSDLCGKIKWTCKDHLEWVFNLKPEAASSANVRIDGELIKVGDSSTDVLNDNPTIMPYHIIKATEYLRVFHDLEDFEFVCKRLGNMCKEWFLQLNQTKNRRTPTWQHFQGSDVPYYRLGDHVWIWKALKGIEEVLNWIESRNHDPSAGYIESAVLHDFSKLRERMFTLMAEKRGRRQATPAEEREQNIYFNSEDLRKENIKRFTVRNEVFNKRMLSVTRSASETRFLLHFRDTVLYYGALWGFFEGQEDLIKALLEIQTRHDDSLCDEMEWTNPLRYGLALLWSRHGYRLAWANSADQMEYRAKRVLLGSSSTTALFYGHLNEDKKATLFEAEEDRDFHFHAGFEIPNILLQSLNHNVAKAFPAEGQQDHEARDSSAGTTQQQVYHDPRPSNDQSSQSRSGTQLVLVPLTLRRQNPYGTYLDVNKIVDVPGEWLFKEPDFLDFTPPDKLEDRKFIVQNASDALSLKKGDASIICTDIGNLQSDNREIQAEARRQRVRLKETGSSGIVLDVRKSHKEKLIGQKRSIIFIEQVKLDLFTNHLLSKRRLDDSKKRVVYIISPTCEMSAICYLATAERDRLSFASFIQKHREIQTSSFHDDVVIETNSWVTEFHCRFFRAISRGTYNWERLHAHRQPKRGGATPGERYSRQLASKLCPPLGNGMYLVDDVFSSIMVGDWCDRHWTCHVLVASTASNNLFKKDWRQENPSFTQRKVLELTLLNNLLVDFHESTKEILRRVEQDSRSSASGMTEELYSTMSFKNRKQELLDEAFQVLRRVKDSINGVRTLIDDWRQRESSQGRERPRWTRSDEQKHGKVLRKQTNELAKHDREINGLLSHVDFLISLVNNEKALSQSRDVTRFTYATVFFLPVGLAVSIFSMSGPPDHTAILGMMITAIVALVITVAFLWLVIRVPTQVYPQSQGIGSLVKVFLARKAGELAHLLGVQDTSKPTNAIQGSVDEVDTDEKKAAQSSHRSMFRRIYDKIAVFSGLRHQHAVQEHEGDGQA
ncbi:hypothetical protein ASPACDRAFT_112700 [Aspergillus aculeatus ATCC 16872]|uniref:Uncharacterized protein n=1 Tax=Aspergillus aculeatus (strain ATCC 16872 / CBS 172.66 / WB 5094) TaxID=690307 RepID=A0A1L9X708_ASPA1|nr:uncharacterized protein ASPACDRAFT_112700 [Aspergillus aculeatus ATCC 16872]OJK04253.1 hypothetical protein ASPACDRAFT_112700 [Aspergillus aculeatus ATCC 16872]